MSTFTGTVDSVELVSLGSALSADAPAGTTVLSVVSTVVFDDVLGGTVDVGGTRYVYTSIDDTNFTITLASGLVTDAFDEDPVTVWDVVNDVAATETRAQVSTADDVDQGGVIDTRVNLSLVPLLPIGVRDDGAGEAAVCSEIDGEWVLTDLPGTTPLIRGELLAPSSIPQVALGFILPGGTKVTVTTDGTPPADPAVDDIWIDTDTTDPTLNTIKKWDGSAWVEFQFGTDAIAAGSVTTPLLAAEAVTAEKVAVGTVVAGIVDATTIEGAQFIAFGLSGEVLIYGGTPAAGNLILAVSGQAGNDAFTNPYLEGVTLSASPNGAGTGYLNWVNQTNHADATTPPKIYAELDGSVPPKIATLWVEGPHGVGVDPLLKMQASGDVTLQDGVGNAVKVSPSSGVTLSSPTALKFNGGPAGLYYAFVGTFSVSVGTGSGSTLVPAVTQVKRNSDYATAWASGVFTAPESCYYDLGVTAIAPVTCQIWAFWEKSTDGGTTYTIIAGDDTTGYSANSSVVTVDKMTWLDAGDKVRTRVRHTAGSTQTITGEVTVARRL